MSQATPTFAALGLRPELLTILEEMAFTRPTDVQLQAYPLVMAGHDLLVQSRTGTGKTLAFVLPILQRLASNSEGVRILAVAPTRELATQVGGVFARVAHRVGIKTATLTGGAGYGEQIRALRQGAQVVVGTPGRLCDHLDRGTLDLSRCEVVVLDEADEILDMGFQEDLERLLSAVNASRQTLLFSATLAEGIEAIARRYMQDPQHLGLSEGLEASTTLTHACYEVSKTSKYEALVNLLYVERPELAILFCHTKAETESLSERLATEGLKVGYLNGDLPQPIRTKTLDAFKRRQITLLVATDVAARGIDVRGLSHVINVDMPRSVETYIHRSGRAGRAGKSGVVLNLITPLDRAKVRQLAQHANVTADYRPIPQAADVRRMARERFFEDLVLRVDEGTEHNLKDFAQDLLTNLDPTALVATLLGDLQAAGGLLAAGYDVETPAPERKRAKEVRERPKREKRDRPAREPEGNMTRLRLNLGKSARIMPGYLVRIICDKAQVTGETIGAIQLYLNHSLVDVRSDVAPRVMAALNANLDDRGRRWTVTLA